MEGATIETEQQFWTKIHELVKASPKTSLAEICDLCHVPGSLYNRLFLYCFLRGKCTYSELCKGLTSNPDVSLSFQTLLQYNGDLAETVLSSEVSLVLTSDGASQLYADLFKPIVELLS